VLAEDETVPFANVEPIHDTLKEGWGLQATHTFGFVTFSNLDFDLFSYDRRHRGLTLIGSGVKTSQMEE